ncbi:MAG: EAL domain-containing protein [Methylovulum sp.]|nr:MAG: EAL domain-containing protein [Methylovulum sp.]
MADVQFPARAIDHQLIPLIAQIATIVQTIIVMTGNLGMLVIAEWVEIDQQKSFLMKYGCVHFQAYLLGRPVPLEEFEALLS